MASQTEASQPLEALLTEPRAVTVGSVDAGRNAGGGAPRDPVAEIRGAEGDASVAIRIDGDLKAHELFLNRELTWLAFNRRVFAEALDEGNPLLERVKFLAITASNLDEFFMKRIGGLKQQAMAGMQVTTSCDSRRRASRSCPSEAR
jgi:Polyphosphate kinase N-terminal domain